MAYRYPSVVERLRPHGAGKRFSNPNSDRAKARRGRLASADDWPELNCVRELLPADVLAAAEDRAERIGIGADRVLIANGTLGEERYVRALGGALGVSFDSLGNVDRRQCPVSDDRLMQATASGLLPLLIDGELCLVVAPRVVAARQISRLIQGRPALAKRFRFTTTECLTGFVFRHADAQLGARAVNHLHAAWPDMSAAPRHPRTNLLPILSLSLAALTAWMLAPVQMLMVAEVMLAIVFLAWLALRLFATTVYSPPPKPSVELAENALPIYTIIVALYREAKSVDGLLSAIERLDYPTEKIDLKLVIEPDDEETRAAILARKTRIPVELITAPPVGPRTKPKALNVALPFARGAFTVIFDAEDRPESNQLRRALQAFDGAGDQLACVQASLSIDNTDDSWLTQLYTAEYAGHFDVFLPALAALRLPLPLGGSSNHFRTATLRALRGWDAYNVTEDADLGIRLARFGYRSAVIASTTYEEAPARFRPWLRQRTRWFKGWMQTWLVHMRSPTRLARDLGVRGFITFQLIVGGNVLAALVHPLFLAALIYAAASQSPFWSDHQTATIILAGIYGTSTLIGYFTSAVLGWMGLARRGLSSAGWVLLLTPVHWLMLSLASWRALIQLIMAPYAWEKTEHGLARSSRRSVKLVGSLVELERLLGKLKKSGHLQPVGATGSRASPASPCGVKAVSSRNRYARVASTARSQSLRHSRAALDNKFYSA